MISYRPGRTGVCSTSARPISTSPPRSRRKARTSDPEAYLAASRLLLGRRPVPVNNLLLNGTLR